MADALESALMAATLKWIILALLLSGCEGIVGTVSPKEWQAAEKLCSPNGGVRHIKSATLAFQQGNAIEVSCNNGLGARFTSTP
jgi:hypothetical protein